MAENHEPDRDIYNLPLAELEPAELHMRGLARLAQSLGNQDAVDQAAKAAQALAFFGAALSAGAVEEPTGSHRAVAPADDRPMRDRVHSG